MQAVRQIRFPHHEFRETDEAVTEFDSKLWLAVIDTVLVRKDGILAFHRKTVWKSKADLN